MMSAYLHVLRRGLFSLAVLGVIGAETILAARVSPVDETVPPCGACSSGFHMRCVRLHRLPRRWRHRLPRRLQLEGRLKADAEMAAKRASGVVEVGNKIEDLPASQNDDRIRWRPFTASTPTTSCHDTRLAKCPGCCKS